MIRVRRVEPRHAGAPWEDYVVLEIDPDGAAWLVEELEARYHRDGGARELVDALRRVLTPEELAR